MKSYERRTQVARAMKREIANCLQSGDIKDDRLNSLVSIIEVDLNSSLSSAKVIYSVLSGASLEFGEDILSESATQAALDDHAGQIRGIVGRKLNLKYAPKLVFTASNSLTKSVDMVDLINRTVSQDEKAKEERSLRN
jgi:ribosome-binding factor A